MIRPMPSPASPPGLGSRLVFNTSPQAATLHIPLDSSGVAEGAMLQTASARPRRAKTLNGAVEVRLAAHSAAIYR